MNRINAICKKFTFVICLLFNTTILGDSGDKQMKNDEEVECSKNVSFLLDGTIKALGASDVKNRDISASGLIGFRYDDERTMIRVSFSAYSSIDTIYSSSPKLYAKSVLNTGITNSGLMAISAEYQNRFIYGEGYLLYLIDKKRETSNMDYMVYKEQLKRANIKDIGFLKKFWGWRGYFEISKIIWKDEKNIAVEGNIISCGFMPTLFSQLSHKKDFNVNITVGLGCTFRIFASDILINRDFRSKLLSSSCNFFVGPEIYCHVKMNNSYGKITFPVLYPDKNIEGLNGGQFVISIGINVDIGSKTSSKLKFDDIERGCTPVR